MVAEKSPNRLKKSVKKVPKFLVAEILDGQPIYYKGYQEVLNGSKTLEEIMGSSSLQAFLIGFILKTLYKNLDDQKYLIFTNEAGLHLDKGSNLSGDILIYERDSLPITNINENYFSLPPKIVIEVDINIDTASLGTEGYVHNKTKKLLDFGVEKVIWVTTPAKTVLIARANEDWQIKDWNKDIDILEQVQINIGAYLNEQGLKLD